MEKNKVVRQKKTHSKIAKKKKKKTKYSTAIEIGGGTTSNYLNFDESWLVTPTNWRKSNNTRQNELSNTDKTMNKNK